MIRSTLTRKLFFRIAPTILITIALIGAFVCTIIIEPGRPPGLI